MLSTWNAYISSASGLAGFFIRGGNRGWRDPTNFCRRIIEAPTQRHGRRFIYFFCHISGHVPGISSKVTGEITSPGMGEEERTWFITAYLRTGTGHLWGSTGRKRLNGPADERRKTYHP